MTEQIEVINEQNILEATFTNVTETVRRFYLMGLGTVSVVQDELVDMAERAMNYTDKLVERGESVEKDGRERVESFLNTRRDQVKDTVKTVETKVGEYSETALNTVKVPTQTHVEDLSKKVASLNRKLDKMRKEQAQA